MIEFYAKRIFALHYKIPSSSGLVKYTEKR